MAVVSHLKAVIGLQVSRERERLCWLTRRVVKLVEIVRLVAIAALVGQKLVTKVPDVLVRDSDHQN